MVHVECRTQQFAEVKHISNYYVFTKLWKCADVTYISQFLFVPFFYFAINK